MRTARRVSQLVFLVGFLVLFCLTIGWVDWTGPAALHIRSFVPVDFFLRIDPLIALSSLISSRSFLITIALWGLPVLALTVLFGRAFCGWVCPLGTCIDAADRAIRPRRQRRTSKETSWPHLKYYLLAGVFVTSLLGAQVVWFFDPQAILVRSLTLGVFAPVQWMLSSLSGFSLIDHVAGGALFPAKQMAFRANLAALLLFAAILSGGLLARRFWCRSLCPLGALLGLVARVPLFRRSVSQSCNECTLCQLDCKMDAVGDRGKAAASAECIYCYSCVRTCRTSAARIVPHRPDSVLPFSLSRRRLLAGAALGALWGFSARTAMAKKLTREGSSSISGPRLIRPPGSVAEDMFNQRCVRCGECMKVCPTNGLQPAISEAGLDGFWTPVLAPRVGECTQKCNLCAQVCPVSAIMPFTIAEKDYIFIGRAAINRSTCVVWESGKQCLVCDEVCSYTAIYWTLEGGGKRPHVDPARCVGCGICENNCPVGGPDAAIRVSCDGDKRSMTREQQKSWRAQNLVTHPEPGPGNRSR